MSYDFDGSATSVLNSRARGVHWLVQCSFTSGTAYYTTAPVDVVSPDGNTYIGLGKALTIEEVNETSNPDTSTINLQLGIVNKAMLALLTGDQSVYRGKGIRLLLQVFTAQFAPIGQPKLRWIGVMNPIKVKRDKPDESNGGTFGYIELPCSRNGLVRARQNKGSRMTHEQQQILYPGDLFFEHMAPLIEKPTPWVTVAFQKAT